MDYLHRVLWRNSYSEMTPEKTNTRPQENQPTSQDTTTEASLSVPYIPRLSEELRRIFKDTKAQIYRGCNTLKSLLMHQKNKILPICTWTWYINEFVLKKLAILHIVENPVSVWRIGLRNTTLQLPAPSTNIALYPQPPQSRHFTLWNHWSG